MSTPPDAVSRWPEHLPVGAVRVGRTSADYDQTIQFYRDLVGLPVLESFKASFGDDGTIFGLPDTASHLEIVRSPEPAVPVDRIDSLVFYLHERRPGSVWWHTSASATVPQPGPQATGTSGHCLCHLLGTAEELGEAAQAPE